MMKIILKAVVLVFAVCALSVSASADMFFNQYIDQDWSVGGNWSDTSDWSIANRVPILSDNIIMENSPVIYNGINAEANNISIGPWGGGLSGNLTVESGGSLHTAGYLWVGAQDTAHDTDGMMTVRGNVTVDDHLIIGANPGTSAYMLMDDGGVLNTLGGGLFVGGNGWGHLDIIGGTINTSYIGFNVWGGGSGAITFNGNGQIISLADQVAEVTDWINWGWIQNAQVDLVDGNTVISQVPEPATMMLLGLGGVLLRRKK